MLLRGKMRILFIIIATAYLAPAFAFEGRVHSTAGRRIEIIGQGAGTLSIGKKIYFFVDGDQTGVGQVLQTFHSKAIVDLRQGGRARISWLVIFCRQKHQQSPDR